MRVRARTLAVAVAVAATAATGVAAASTGDSSSAASIDSPMPLVEDYSYPGADTIFAEYGVRLIEGDGNIVLAECGSKPDLIGVYSSELNDPHQQVCFDVLAESGYLRLELADVYGIGADNHTVEATITVDNQTETVDVPPGEWKGVGVSDGDKNTGPATLLVLKAS